MKVTFLYPDARFSPHKSLEQWALSVSQAKVKTPKGIGLFDIKTLPESDILLIESLYCLPFAKKYKDIINKITKQSGAIDKMTKSSGEDLAIGKNKKCKIIAMIVDTSFWPEKLSIFRKLFYKLYLDSVDGFITLSERSKKDIENFMKNNGYKRKPIIVIRPFVANEIKMPDFGTKSAIVTKSLNKHSKSDLAIGKKTLNKNILFIGNEAEEKGYLKLVKAMDYLPDFKLYLVGNCKTKLPAGLSKNIHAEGRVKDLKKYFEQCTYYCHPADFEPFGVAPLEAMYAGLIPILTKDVGMTEIFPDSMKMLLLDSNEPQHIARMIQFIDSLSVKEKLKLSKEAMKLAADYTKDKNIKLFKREFKRLSQLI